jgi:hypothetical protein
MHPGADAVASLAACSLNTVCRVDSQIAGQSCPRVSGGVRAAAPLHPSADCVQPCPEWIALALPWHDFLLDAAIWMIASPLLVFDEAVRYGLSRLFVDDQERTREGEKNRKATTDAPPTRDEAGHCRNVCTRRNQLAGTSQEVWHLFGYCSEMHRIRSKGARITPAVCLIFRTDDLASGVTLAIEVIHPTGPSRRILNSQESRFLDHFPVCADNSPRIAHLPDRLTP